MYIYTHTIPFPRSLPQNVLSQLRHYDTTQPSLASDVKAYLSSASAAASMLTNKGKADRKSLVEMITNYQIMAGLVSLFELDPMLAFSAPPQVYTCTCTQCRTRYIQHPILSTSCFAVAHLLHVKSHWQAGASQPSRNNGPIFLYIYM